MGYGSYSAAVAEVSVGKEGKVKVHRMVLALDCGHAVNPDQIAAQVEGSVAYRLERHVLRRVHGRQRTHRARPTSTTYRVLRLAEMPKVETVIVPTYDFWGGVGEPTICVVAPAVLNAIFAATGKPVRSLPLKNQRICVAKAMSVAAARSDCARQPTRCARACAAACVRGEPVGDAGPIASSPTAFPSRSPPVPGDAARGRALIVARDSANCVLCHAVPDPDVRFAGDLGPSLARDRRAAVVPQLRLRVVDNLRVNPATIMPSYYRSRVSIASPRPTGGKPILTARKSRTSSPISPRCDDARSNADGAPCGGVCCRGRRAGARPVGARARRRRRSAGHSGAHDVPRRPVAATGAGAPRSAATRRQRAGRADERSSSTDRSRRDRTCGRSTSSPKRIRCRRWRRSSFPFRSNGSRSNRASASPARSASSLSRR